MAPSDVRSGITYQKSSLNMQHSPNHGYDHLINVCAPTPAPAPAPKL